MPYKIKFAQRTGWPLDSNPLINRLEELRRDNRTVLDLTESNPTACGLKFPADKITDALLSKENLSYQPSARGMPAVREAIARDYREKRLSAAAENIFLTASTSEAYAFLFRLLVDPKEGILVPSPSYPLFEFLVELNDARIDTYPLIYGNGWHMDPKALERDVHPDTKALILVHPNNPTGSFLKHDELKEINRICREHNLAIICDEVFSDYAFKEDKERVLSLVENDKVLTFVLGGLSKCLALPQMKLAWIAVNGPGEDVKQAVKRLEIILDGFLSVNTPSQNALSKWLSLKKDIQKEVIVRIGENRTLLEETLAGFPRCAFLNSEGGWYAVLKLPAGLDEEKWVYELLDRDKVFVHPGYFFDFKEEGHIVVSLLTAPDVLKEGLTRALKRL